MNRFIVAREFSEIRLHDVITVTDMNHSIVLEKSEDYGYMSE